MPDTLGTILEPFHKPLLDHTKTKLTCWVINNTFLDLSRSLNVSCSQSMQFHFEMLELECDYGRDEAI